MRILLATDARPASSGAVRLTLALAAERDATVEVIRVIEPLVPAGPEFTYMPISHPVDIDAGRREVALDQLQAFLVGFGPGTADWPQHVVTGAVAPTILRAAEGMDLVVLGLGNHDLRSRVFGGETALRVAHMAHSPVLAVPESATALPRVALVATDFSGFARDAVATAIEILEPAADLHLAHVLWQPADGLAAPATGQWTDPVRAKVREHVARWANEIPGIERVRPHVHLLEGKVVEELLRVAGELKVDLLVAGSHGHGFFSRAILGSVSTKLLRGSATTILIAPPKKEATAG